MPTRIAINGFGRTGRMFIRAAPHHPDLEPVAVNDFINGQMLQDRFHKDLHCTRVATLSMMPTSTGAAKAIGLALPTLKGKLDSIAVHVPTANASLVDLTATL